MLLQVLSLRRCYSENEDYTCMINYEHGKYSYFIHKCENTWACFDASFTGLVSNENTI